MDSTDQGTTARPRPARMIAVVGATGGTGTSTLAAALARSLRRSAGETTLVDLDAPGAGIDVLLGVEGAPGARWPDLADARGTVDGAGLLAALPRWSGVPVLSVSRHTASPPADAVVLDVTTALVRAGHRVVLDLPRPSGWGPAVRSLLTAADAVVLVVGRSAGGVAGAVAARRALTGLDATSVHLVAGPSAPGRVEADDVARSLGLPVAVTLARDARAAAAVERGDGPRTGHRTPAGRAAAQLVAAVSAPQPGRSPVLPGNGSRAATGAAA